MTTNYGNPARFVSSWLATVLQTVPGITVQRVGGQVSTTGVSAYAYVVGGGFPELLETGAPTGLIELRCIIAVQGPVAQEGAVPQGHEETEAYAAIYDIIAAVLAADYEDARDVGSPYSSRIYGVRAGGHDGVYASGDTSFRVGIEFFVTCRIVAS